MGWVEGADVKVLIGRSKWFACIVVPCRYEKSPDNGYHVRPLPEFKKIDESGLVTHTSIVHVLKQCACNVINDWVWRGVCVCVWWLKEVEVLTRGLKLRRCLVSDSYGWTMAWWWHGPESVPPNSEKPSIFRYIQLRTSWYLPKRR